MRTGITLDSLHSHSILAIDIAFFLALALFVFLTLAFALAFSLTLCFSLLFAFFISISASPSLRRRAVGPVFCR